MTLLLRLLRRSEGQDLAEYGIALAVISASTVLIANFLRGPIQDLWTNAQTAIG